MVSVLFGEVGVSTQADETDTEDEVDAPVFSYECEFCFFHLIEVIKKFHATVSTRRKWLRLLPPELGNGK